MVIHTWALYGPMVVFSIRMDRWQPLKVPQKKTSQRPWRAIGTVVRHFIVLKIDDILGIE